VMARSTAVGSALDAYNDIFGAAAMDRIRNRATSLQGARILHLSLTSSGTHHSRMLSAAVPLLTNVGIEVTWSALQPDAGDAPWSDAIYKAIDGEAVVWHQRSTDAWRRFGRRHAPIVDGGYDMVVVHDPQLLALRTEARRAKRGTQWMWHSHFDLRDCEETVARMITSQLAAFDVVAVEHPTFAGSVDMPCQTVIPPVIDPLAGRNAQLPPKVIERVLRRYELRPEWPLVVEVSPFDGWDDPQWAIYEFQAARKLIPNLQLALVATSPSIDDPFSQLNGARRDANIRLLRSQDAGDVEINALQGAAVVAMQNAVRKGFSTALLEASWKGRPVLASEGGAMTHQVVHGTTGYLFANFDEATERIVRFVDDRNFSDALGFNGHRLVREDHLVVRWVDAYLSLLAPAVRTVA
jgi:trehalose synthase